MYEVKLGRAGAVFPVVGLLAALALAQQPANAADSPTVMRGRQAAPSAVVAAQVSSFTFSPASAVVGETVVGLVRLVAPAPRGGTTVRLWPNTSYGQPAGLEMPLEVLVPAGQAKVRFPVTLRSASVPVVVRPSAETTAAAAEPTAARLLAVPPGFQVAGGPVLLTKTTWLAVGLGRPARDQGEDVALTTNVRGVRVPALVHVPAGARGTTFAVTVGENPDVLTIGGITATWDGRTSSARLFFG